MKWVLDVLIFCFAIIGVGAHPFKDDCPKDELACQDVINSSQCIAQIVIDHMKPLSKENLIKCLESDEPASDLPGATKVRY
jgi:hypothetical protein